MKTEKGYIGILRIIPGEFPMSSTTSKPKSSLKGRKGKLNEKLVKYGTFAIIIFILFILGGGIYDIIERPPAFLQGANGAVATVHPYPGEQTINESIISIAMYGVTFVGLLLVYRSTSILYDKQKANTQILIGIGLALAGIAVGYVLFSLKG
jgi:hypothetical protein